MRLLAGIKISPNLLVLGRLIRVGIAEEAIAYDTSFLSLWTKFGKQGTRMLWLIKKESCSGK